MHRKYQFYLYTYIYSNRFMIIASNGVIGYVSYVAQPLRYLEFFFCFNFLIYQDNAS